MRRSIARPGGRAGEHCAWQQPHREKSVSPHGAALDAACLLLSVVRGLRCLPTATRSYLSDKGLNSSPTVTPNASATLVNVEIVAFPFPDSIPLSVGLLIVAMSHKSPFVSFCFLRKAAMLFPTSFLFSSACQLASDSIMISRPFLSKVDPFNLLERGSYAKTEPPRLLPQTGVHALREGAMSICFCRWPGRSDAQSRPHEPGSSARGHRSSSKHYKPKRPLRRCLSGSAPYDSRMAYIRGKPPVTIFVFKGRKHVPNPKTAACARRTSLLRTPLSYYFIASLVCLA